MRWLIIGVCLAGMPAHAAPADRLAALRALNVDLLTHDSATATLQLWCATHHLAAAPRIVARVLREPPPALPQGIRTDLAAGPFETLRYRHVQLFCGDRILSDAENWYLPGRLTPRMNDVLETTDTPFGRAVAALGFRRQTLSATLLWSGSAVGPIPWFVLRHRAILRASGGPPIAEVVENYTSDTLK